MPTPIDQVIAYANLYQDVELASAISSLQSAGQVNSFIQAQQSKVYRDIIKQKEDTFSKVYGDLNRAGKVQDSVLLYNKRTKDLATIQEQIYNNQKNSADAVVEDNHTASRKTEMNEWTVNNKKDTLFVYSTLFIMLSGLLLITGLWRIGMINGALWVGITVLLLLIFSLIVANRAYYTDNLRNRRFWNKKIFEGKYGKVPDCQNLNTDLNAAQDNIQTGMAGVSQGVASASQGLANMAQGYGQ